MYLVHFGRSPAAATATAAATAAATVPVPQARRRAVPSIGTEASESCNLPRALTLGAAAAAAAAFAAFLIFKLQISKFNFQICNLFLHKWNKLNFVRNLWIHIKSVHRISLCFTCVRLSCFRSSLFASHAVFSVVVVTIAVVVVVVVPCFVVSFFRCYRVFRCRWPSSYSLSVEHSQRQWSSQGAADLLQAFQRYTIFTEIFISQTCPCRDREPERVGERWTRKSFRISNEFDALVYIITQTAQQKEKKRERERNREE